MMEFVITIGIVVIVITCLSIDGKLSRTSKQNEVIIKLLKQDKK